MALSFCSYLHLFKTAHLPASRWCHTRKYQPPNLRAWTKILKMTASRSCDQTLFFAPPEQLNYWMNMLSYLSGSFRFDHHLLLLYAGASQWYFSACMRRDCFGWAASTGWFQSCVTKRKISSPAEFSNHSAFPPKWGAGIGVGELRAHLPLRKYYF